jgi:hypothetical protein
LTSALSVGRVFQAFVICRPTFSKAFCSGRAKPSRWCPMFLTSLERSACILLERRVPIHPRPPPNFAPCEFMEIQEILK